jgi:hypothetical protein
MFYIYRRTSINPRRATYALYNTIGQPTQRAAEVWRRRLIEELAHDNRTYPRGDELFVFEQRGQPQATLEQTLQGIK